MVNTDNQSVVASINLQGMTRFQELLDATLELFQIVNVFGIMLRVRHIAGIHNVLADGMLRLSRSLGTEWSLHLEIFRQMFDVGVIDLFATRSNHKLTLFASPYPESQAWKVDALNISLEGLVAYAYPPPALLNTVVDKIRATSNLKLTLIAPWCTARTWFPLLVELADDPTPVPRHTRLLRCSIRTWICSTFTCGAYQEAFTNFCKSKDWSPDCIEVPMVGEFPIFSS